MCISYNNQTIIRINTKYVSNTNTIFNIHLFIGGAGDFPALSAFHIIPAGAAIKRRFITAMY